MLKSFFKHRQINPNSLNNNAFQEYNNFRKFKKECLCYAPFKSLTFFLAGDVMACWHNKQYLLGHYPENSINEIWFGEKLKVLREKINENDLSFGCFECKKNILAGNYSSVSAWRYDYLSLKKSDYPISLDFQISNICNFECIMCNGEYSITVRQNRELKQPYINPYDDNFITQLEPFIPHLQEASFSGGESFVINQYYKIWEKIYEINPNVIISVTTNGSILNNKAKDILEKLKFNITLSIDSVNKKNYEFIRKNGNFENLLKNLEYFKQYTEIKKTSLSVRICPIQQNWKEIPEIFEYFNKQDIELFFNSVIFPPYSSLWNLNSVKLSEIYNFLKSYTFSNKTIKQKENNKYYNDLLKQIDEWIIQAKKRENELPNLNESNISLLKNILIEKVNENLKENKSFDENKKNEFKLFFENVLNLCESEIPDINILKNAFIYYLNFPTNRLIDEFNIRNTEKIISLTKQAGKTEYHNTL